MDKQQSLAPFTDGEILQAFGTDHATSKHLLIIYSMVVGTGAQRIIDLGIGQTTRALRAAAAVTGGVVLSCDFDRRRYDYLLPLQDESWRLSLEDSGHFLANLDAPFDFVMHDAAHHYAQVRRDIETLLPKMRRFGLICVHDAQQADLGQGILKAVMDATVGAATSSTVMVSKPFSPSRRLAASTMASSRARSICSLKDGRGGCNVFMRAMLASLHPAQADNPKDPHPRVPSGRQVLRRRAGERIGQRIQHFRLQVP